MATRRRDAAAQADSSQAAGAGRGQSASAVAAAALPPSADPLPPSPAPSPVPAWFSFCYWGVLAGIILGSALWFALVFTVHPSHVAYDPMRTLPTLVRDDVHLWYQKHGNNATDAAPVDSPGQSMKALLLFLVRFHHADFFSAEGSGTSGYYEHYVHAMTGGWIAGVFEGMRMDEGELARMEAERAGVGSIPGGSRRLNEHQARMVSPIVSQLDDGEVAVPASVAGADVPTQQRAGVSSWSILSEEQQNWVFEGLAHCNTSPCRLAKMQLVARWQERLAQAPEHARREQWRTATQLFHPDSQPDSLLDAPATAQTLASLWYRFFGSGDGRYLSRIVELSVLTGAPAYQQAKDAEVRHWHAAREQRRQDRIAAATAEEQKTGVPAPDEPSLAPLAPLPPSPTAELHQHFLSSLHFYGAYGADGKGFTLPHAAVRKAIHQAWRKAPNEPVLRQLLEQQAFRLEEPEGASQSTSSAQQ